MGPFWLGYKELIMASHHGNHPNEHFTLDRVFEALSHPVRRYILTTLKNGKTCDVTEFVSPSRIPNDVDSNTIEIQLHHQHLPLLDDAGFIYWDRDLSIVSPGPEFEHANHFLTVMEDS